MDATKINNVKSHLVQYGSITPKDAYYLYRTMRLSDIIFKLRNRGWVIDTEMITINTPDGGMEAFAKYVLKEAAE